MRRLIFVLLFLAGAAHAAGWSDYLKNLKKKQRPKQRTAIAGVRGWSPEEAAADVDGRDYEGLDRVIQLQPSASEVAGFVKEGGLAP